MTRSILILVLAVLSQAAPARAAPEITVQGTGAVSRAPDMAEMRLGVVTEAADAAAAMARNGAAMTAVIAALRAGGIAEADIRTTAIDLSPQWRRDGDNPPQVVAFRASNSVAVTVADLDALGGLIDAAIAAGANQTGGIRFGLADEAEAEAADAARRRAVADARHKAEILAEAAGHGLGAVLDIREGGAPPVPGPMAEMSFARAADAGTPVAAGELAIRATVTIRYALAE